MGNVCSRNVSAPKSQATPTRTRFRSVAERSRHEHETTNAGRERAIAEIEKALEESSVTVDEEHSTLESSIDEDYDPSNPFVRPVTPVHPLPSWRLSTATSDAVKQEFDVRSPTSPTVPPLSAFNAESRAAIKQLPGSTSGSYRFVRALELSRSTSSLRSASLERQRSPRVVEFAEEPDVGAPHSFDFPEPTLRSNSNSSRLDGSVQQDPPATLA